MMGDMLFTGDTLMSGAIGRTDLPGGNRDQLVASVRTLTSLPGETRVFAGHGPSTSVAAEFAPDSRVTALIR
jgi:glyoxylase-like metal-dependent hydrolase (beta-lactamase superfamily II)